MTEQINFDDYTANYSAQLKEQTKLFTSDDAYFAQYKVNITKALTNTPARILEFGCGIGRNISFLKTAYPGAEIYGSDISLESLAVAREMNPQVQFIPEAELAGRNERFDLIFIAGVYHHIPCSERSSVTKQLYDRLAPGGELMIFEHNPYNPITRRIVSSCPYDKGVVLLSPKSLSQFIVDAGFSLFHRGYCLFFPPWLPYLSKLEPYLRWLPLGGQYWVRAIK